MATFLALTTYIPLHINILGYQIGVFHIVVLLSLGYYLSIGVSAAVIIILRIGYYGDCYGAWYFGLDVDV